MPNLDETPGPLFEPSPEHEFLAQQVGTWDVRCSYSMGPGVAPIEVSGIETAEMLGSFWLVTRFEADLLGTPMHGQASTGYDPIAKHFIGNWRDSSIPFLYRFEGFLDGEKRFLRMSGENYDPLRGIRAMYRCVIEYISKNEKVLTLSVELAGGEVNTILEYHYKRRRA